MIAVPDAALLPSVFRPMRRSNSAITSPGKPSGKVGKARSRIDAGHLPVPGDRVLPGGSLGHPAVGAGRRVNRRHAVDVGDAREPERAQCRQLERDGAREVAERVAPAIAVGVRVGQLADTNAVEDREKHAIR